MCGVFLDKFHTLQDPRQSTLRDVFHSPVPDADLMEARAELQSFAAGMGKQGPEPSTAPPSEAETYQGPQHMHHEVTREKRVEPDGERPPAKFAKGDAKGEPRTRRHPAAREDQLRSAPSSMQIPGLSSRRSLSPARTSPARDGTTRSCGGTADRATSTPNGERARGTRTSSWRRTPAFETSSLRWRGWRTRFPFNSWMWKS